MSGPRDSSAGGRRWSARASYVTLALVAITAGLAVHGRGEALSPVARDVLGDMLWAMMIVWWLGAVMPGLRSGWRAAVASALCVAVELSQLYHAPALDAFRGTRVGHLVLGSGFDPRDLGAYALGVAGAVLLEGAAAALIRRRRTAG